ncbi:MAG: hypothetical protein NC302_01590 [Bacteroidales bacterium]|nr:hypothetical protein [Bacteroidales bacterium]MCM1414667.1 hypothetical protein [bacterium]
MEMQEKENELNQEAAPETLRTRRVGSVTFGLTLILFGILFLIHIVLPKLHYAVIFRMWPVVFILLGVEILAENHKSDAGKCKIIYDFPAILMLMAAGDAVSFSRISCVPAG